MAKVIKAGLTRIAEPLETQAKPLAATEEEKPFSEEEAAAPAEETAVSAAAPADTAAQEAEFQAAYDELIAAAEDEVLLMLKDAREEASQLTQAAQAQADDIRAAAHREGYAAGLSEGRQEIFPLLERAQGEVDEIMRSAYAERDKMLSECEPQALALALDAAEKILGYELDRQSSVFMSMVESAMKNIKADKHVTLRVSPDEYVRFFQAKDISLESSSGQVAVTAVSDPTLPAHGCLIEMEGGAVDASPSAQLEQIRRNLDMHDA